MGAPSATCSFLVVIQRTSSTRALASVGVVSIIVVFQSTAPAAVFASVATAQTRIERGTWQRWIFTGTVLHVCWVRGARTHVPQSLHERSALTPILYVPSPHVLQVNAFTEHPLHSPCWYWPAAHTLQFAWPALSWN